MWEFSLLVTNWEIEIMFNFILKEIMYVDKIYKIFFNIWTICIKVPQLKKNAICRFRQLCWSLEHSLSLKMYWMFEHFKNWPHDVLFWNICPEDELILEVEVNGNGTRNILINQQCVVVCLKLITAQFLPVS